MNPVEQRTIEYVPSWHPIRRLRYKKHHAWRWASAIALPSLAEMLPASWLRGLPAPGGLDQPPHLILHPAREDDLCSKYGRML